VAAPESFEQRAAAVQKSIRLAQRNADESLKNKDRSKIAKLVMYLWAGVVAVSFFFIVGVFALGIYWGQALCGAVPVTGCIEWKQPADFLLQLLTTAVLPIVTLVLGYYFGTQAAGAEEES